MPKPYSTVARIPSPHVAGRHGRPAGAARSAAAAAHHAAVRRAVAEALEGRQLFSVAYDAAGFTVVTPGDNDRAVYVSTSGSDNNSGFSESAPVRTINRAKALVRAGTGDQLLLRRGDTFREPVGTWTKGGRSAGEPMVLGAYGDGARPTVATGKASALTTGSSSARTINHLVVQGIRFYADARDPSSGSFAGGGGGNEGLRLLAGTNNTLIEDVEVDGYTTNVTVSGFFGPVSNVRLRRCVVTDAYNPGGHAQGLYADRVGSLSVEESVFDRNGWAAGISGAHPTIYNHNLYIKENVDGFVARGNLISNASSHGLQARAAG
jgi:hypothetical protein